MKKNELDNRTLYLITSESIEEILVDDFIKLYCPNLLVRREGIYKEVVRGVVRNIYVAPNDNAIRYEAFLHACSAMNNKSEDKMVARTKEEAVRLIIENLQDAMRHKDFVEGCYRFRGDTAKFKKWADRLQDALSIEKTKIDSNAEVNSNGRPKLTNDVIKQIVRLSEQGCGTSEIARKLGISKASVYKYVNME